VASLSRDIKATQNAINKTQALKDKFESFRLDTFNTGNTRIIMQQKIIFEMLLHNNELLIGILMRVMTQ
jgi:hypothetical protein